MIVDTFNVLVHQPLYNGLVFLIDVVPYADVGIAVVLLTALVKVILFPLAHRASVMQQKVKAITPEIEALKEKYKDDKQKQTLEMLALYKRENIKPFLSMLVVLIQLPIVFGLYWVFYKGGLPAINIADLYSFVPVPGTVNMQFLGIVDMVDKSIVLALLAGVTQYAYSVLVLPVPAPRGENPSLKDDLAHSFHLQMKYIMPVIITIVAYTISAAVALYWVTSNVFMIGQELLVRKLHARTHSAESTGAHTEASI